MIALRKTTIDRFSTAPEGESGLNSLCAGYQQPFQHIDDALRFKPPTDVMASAAQQDAALRHRLTTARRNDPCPCGSGHTVKHCHGQREEARSPANRGCLISRERSDQMADRSWGD